MPTWRPAPPLSIWSSCPAAAAAPHLACFLGEGLSVLLVYSVAKPCCGRLVSVGCSMAGKLLIVSDWLWGLPMPAVHIHLLMPPSRWPSVGECFLWYVASVWSRRIDTQATLQYTMSQVAAGTRKERAHKAHVGTCFLPQGKLGA